MGADKILTMVDLCGSEKAYQSYRTVVDQTLPKGVNRDRYMAMLKQVAQQFANDDRLDRRSIMPCLHNAVKLGLNPDPAMGQIYFVPYNGKLTYQVGYKGMLELARRSGQIRDMRAYIVDRVDEFSFHEDERGQHFIFRPRFDGQHLGELLVLSVATLADGSQVAHPMESARIDEIKKRVLARTPGSPWKDTLFETEMRKKTAIRRHCKTLPVSPELAQAIEDDERAERGDQQTIRHEELSGILEQVEIAAPAMAAPAPAPAPAVSAAPSEPAAQKRRGRPPAAPAPAPQPEPETEQEEQVAAPAASPAPASAQNDLW
jgi:recombination protein RecT